MRSFLSENCEIRTFCLSETRVSDMWSRPDAISWALSGRKLSNASRRFLTSAKLGLRGPRARDLAFSARFSVNVVHSPAHTNTMHWSQATQSHGTGTDLGLHDFLHLYKLLYRLFLPENPQSTVITMKSSGPISIRTVCLKLVPHWGPLFHLLVQDKYSWVAVYWATSAMSDETRITATVIRSTASVCLYCNALTFESLDSQSMWVNLEMFMSSLYQGLHVKVKVTGATKACLCVTSS